MKLTSFLLTFVLYYCVSYSNEQRHAHHSSYQVTHHMGQMKIKANPEGADFDFSGGDLHVDLHPAHSDVVPIYNYFHSDYHDYHVIPVEHHMYEEMSHHSGEHEGHHMMGRDMEDDMHHGEDEGGYDHQHLHHHNYHDNDERQDMHHDMHHGMHHGMHHEMNQDDYDHHHLHHHRIQDNDERHGDMHDMHEDYHHSGDHMDHHMSHMDGHHDAEEMEADHGHEDMPHVFPIGLWHPGEGGEGHHGGESEGHHEGGGGGDGHDSSLGEPQYVGGHHELTGHHEFNPGNIHHNREEHWGDNMGHQGAGDFGGYAEHGGGGYGGGGYGGGGNEEGSYGGGNHGGECIRSNVQDGYNNENPRCQRSDVHSNYTKKANKTENAEARNFHIKPIRLKGSIREKFRKHWDDEEKGNEEQDDDETSRETYKHHATDVEEEDPPVHHTRHYDDEDGELMGHPVHHTRHHYKESKPQDDTRPTADEFIRNHNYPKKIYPTDHDSSGDGKERVDPPYKVQDKLSAQELQLSKDIEREEGLQRLNKKEQEEQEREIERMVKKKAKENIERERVEKEEQLKQKEEREAPKDDVEKDIESKEKEIQAKSENAYTSIEETKGKIKDDEEGPDDPPEERKRNHHRQGELVWNKEMPVYDIKHKSHHHHLGGGHTHLAHEHRHETFEGRHHRHDDDNDDDDDYEDEDDRHDEGDEKNEDDRDEESYDNETDDEEKRQHNFHDSISHKKEKSFYSLEKPHEGVEKFRKNDEEIDINDRTHEGDVDQMDALQKLEEVKNRLPIQDERESERFSELNKSFVELPQTNEKEESDREMGKIYEQNEDPKLEGSDHEYFHDHSNFVNRQNNDNEREREREREREDDFGNRRHNMNSFRSVNYNKPNDDVIERPRNEEEVDRRLLGDFKSRFNEETSFQSVEQAEELLNQLQETAMSTQKKVEQSSGSVTDNGLVSATIAHNAKPNNAGETKASKRHGVRPNISKLIPYERSDDRTHRTNIAQLTSKDLNNIIPEETSRAKLPNENVVDRNGFDEDKKRHDLVFKNFFLIPSLASSHKLKRRYKIYSKRGVADAADSKHKRQIHVYDTIDDDQVNNRERKLKDKKQIVLAYLKRPRTESKNTKHFVSIKIPSFERKVV